MICLVQLIGSNGLAVDISTLIALHADEMQCILQFQLQINVTLSDINYMTLTIFKEKIAHAILDYII